MKNKKITFIILIVGLFISGIAVGAIAVYLITGVQNDVPSVDMEASVPVTEEQYQFLRASILEIDDMDNIERRNAWLILDAMREIDFVESGQPGQSRVSLATWVLKLLDIGEITELTVVRFELGEFDNKHNDMLVIRIVNIKNNIYYFTYDRGRGLGRITMGSEDGERIYSRAIHTIRDGQLCRREYPRGPIISCR